MCGAASGILLAAFNNQYKSYERNQIHRFASG